MNVHKNAPLTPKGREAMVRSLVAKPTSSIARQAKIPVFAAGTAHSAATGFPSISATRNCETCHVDIARAVARRAMKSRQLGSGQPSAMSNQPRDR
ncbi:MULTISPECIES: hypothetical protein [unclassified Bradyrhizobium]